MSTILWTIMGFIFGIFGLAATFVVAFMKNKDLTPAPSTRVRPSVRPDLPCGVRQPSPGTTSES